MSLESYFPEQFEAVRRYLDEGEAPVRRIVIDPEMEEMFLKAMGRMQEDEGFFHIFLLHRGDCADASAWFDALTAVVEEAVADAAAELAPAMARIEALRRTRDRVSAPQHFLQLAEAVADGMPDECGRLCVILAPGEADPALYARSARFLAEEARSEWLRFLVLDRRQAPCLQDLGLPRQQFWLGPEEIERRVAEDLKSGALPARQRRQYLAMAAGFHVARGEHAEAARLQRQALAEARAGDDPAETATALYNFANSCSAAKRYPEAIRAYTEAADLCVEHRNAALAPFVYVNLGAALHRSGDPGQARASLKVARDMFRAIGHVPGEAHVCDVLGELQHGEGNEAEAARSWRYAHGLYDRITAAHFADLRATGKAGMEEKLRRIGAAAKEAPHVR